ncbi:predicted protein [Nematostella vectensis]|uniref:Kazal-like domain-containing protein n=2 Tax=Nematostella vectensis TaxID=45351 RepID=A7SRA3_NEMVE|nr:predicted protein [Nematostella vectensis]|eukprot:XP_001625880.1 predicted protein [Nematostella vectensis]
MPITDSSSNSPCATKVCTSPPHSVCKPVGGVPKCVCPSSCPSFRAVKCGSDGVLYDNQCKMEQAACVKNMTITETPRKSCTG